MTQQEEIKEPDTLVRQENEEELDHKEDDVFMAIQALGQLKNSRPSQSPPAEPQQQQQQETFLDKVTSHPLISNSIKMIEKNIQNNKRRWFQEEPQKLQNLKELSLANFNIESRRKLQMLINFLKLGNKQLNTRIENLSQICEQERLKKLGLNQIPEAQDDEDDEDDEFHDAKDDSIKTTQLNTSQSPSPDLSHAEQQQPQEIKSEIVGTVKKIVKVVSKFTGNSLPEPARSHVRELLLKLPNNWAVMTSSQQQQQDTNGSLFADQLDPNGKVLILAQESLEMIKKILNLCNENLNSLENWNCLKVEEQKFLKEKILIKNHHYYVLEDKIDESKEEDEEEEEEQQRKKRIKIGINDLVNEEDKQDFDKTTPLGK